MFHILSYYKIWMFLIQNYYAVVIDENVLKFIKKVSQIKMPEREGGLLKTLDYVTDEWWLLSYKGR